MWQAGSDFLAARRLPTNPVAGLDGLKLKTRTKVQAGVLLVIRATAAFGLGRVRRGKDERVGACGVQRNVI